MAGYGIGAPPVLSPKTTAQQEATTLLIFIPFSVLFVKEEIRLDFLWAGLCVHLRTEDVRRLTIGEEQVKKGNKGALQPSPLFPFFYDKPRILTWRINYLSSLTKIGFE
jgi:hypothetical protein